MLLLFGSVYANMEGGLDRSFQRTAPGILIGAALFFSCLSGPVTLLVAERERHTLKRLLLTPLSGTGYFLGLFLGAPLARRTEDATGPVAAIGVPLLVLGGTFFPVSLLPPFLLSVAWFDPVFHMNVAFKAISHQGTGLDEIGVNVLVLAVCAAAAMAIGISSYRALPREERSR